MRIFIADLHTAFIHQLKQVFRHTTIRNDLYPVVMQMQPDRVFRAAAHLQVTCLVQPDEKSCKLTLTRDASGNFTLACPLATSANTRILMKQVLRFLYSQPHQFDAIVMPCMGEPTMQTAKAMQHAFVDSIINL